MTPLERMVELYKVHRQNKDKWEEVQEDFATKARKVSYDLILEKFPNIIGLRLDDDGIAWAGGIPTTEEVWDCVAEFKAEVLKLLPDMKFDMSR